MATEVELSKEKLDINAAMAHLQKQIDKLQQDKAILAVGFEAVSKGESMMHGEGVVAGMVREVMRELVNKI